ncbi:putative ribonuclease CAF1 [Paratrimastix pyriformis]|uniref:Ribonuclease CAF1 n=1 Tax=Paratrimastix pyriformis TaxID=342808 RepID=A0ABQ8UKJ9_9EUKA|nr:putative ribonuclease CAF1 [Paratrimastix pyriformis]
MQVYKSNFRESLKVLTESMESCAYVAFDWELTGVQGLGAKEFPWDTPSQRYEKLRPNVSYSAIQLGICTAHPVLDASGELTIRFRPFNFTVWPHASMLLMSNSALHFLRDHHFDLNKAIDDGVSFLNAKQETEKTQRLKQLRTDLEAGQTGGMVPSARDRPLVVDVFKLVDEWLLQLGLDPAAERSSSAYAPDPKPSAPAAGAPAAGAEPPTLLLPKLNSYMRRLVFQETEKCYHRVHFEVLEQDGALRRIKATLMESAAALDAHRKKLIQEKLAKYEDELSDEIGLRHVFRLLSTTRRPLVGHNSMMDCLQLIDKLEATLPADLPSCRALIHSKLPAYFDTRFLATTHPAFRPYFDKAALESSSASLEPLSLRLQYAPFTEVPAPAPAVRPAGPAKSPAPAGSPTATPAPEAAAPAPAAAPKRPLHLQLDPSGPFGRYAAALAANITAGSLAATAPAGSPPGTAEAAQAQLEEASMAHEAGYDALLTALVFGRMAAHLAQLGPAPAPEGTMQIEGTAEEDLPEDARPAWKGRSPRLFFNR